MFKNFKILKIKYLNYKNPILNFNAAHPPKIPVNLASYLIGAF